MPINSSVNSRLLLVLTTPAPLRLGSLVIHIRKWVFCWGKALPRTRRPG